ncbi:hypothetical protein BSKO_11643 [Bryopsis sp. KO-2023]|nr:hypothetical protein BSKO_11643 [Bryopsis sp. KO-2023]
MMMIRIVEAGMVEVAEGLLAVLEDLVGGGEMEEMVAMDSEGFEGFVGVRKAVMSAQLGFLVAMMMRMVLPLHFHSLGMAPVVMEMVLADFHFARMGTESMKILRCHSQDKAKMVKTVRMGGLTGIEG